MNAFQSLAVVAVAALGASLTLASEEAPQAAKGPTDAELIAAQKPSYPLTTCPIGGEALTSKGEPVDVVHEGRLVRLCCQHCAELLPRKADEVFAKIDAAVVSAQSPIYPLESCVVSGEPLGGSMGEPVDLVHGTRLVRLCCSSCKRGFAKRPAAFIEQIDAALIVELRKTYPLPTCILSGEPLASKSPVDRLYGVELVRLCCKRCASAFDKNPEKFAMIARTERARLAAAKEGAEKETATPPAKRGW